MLEDLWPLFGLRLTTPRLELRLPREADFGALCAAAGRGIHADDFMPFLFPWSTQPEPQRTRASLQNHWKHWASWRPDDWTLHLMVSDDSGPIGIQDLGGRDFAVRREVSSGSWLERARQGKGLGTEMRAAVLHLAFAGLGADWAVSAAFTDNPASLGVSRRLGYADDGLSVYKGHGEGPRLERRLRLDRAAWEAHRTVPVEVHGLAPCREMFGLPGA